MFSSGRIKNGLGVFVVLLSKRAMMMMMMMMLLMYVAVVIELKTCVRIRTKCVNIVDRCHSAIAEIERDFNGMGLIDNHIYILDGCF
jgi:hypothetical protein